MTSNEHIEAVMSMKDYIHLHLHQTITLNDLAKACGYSQWHCSRMFKEVVRMTPFQYIRDVRLSMAASEIISEDRKIVDVALDFVFDSHEGFTRAFSKRFGINPKKYQQSQKPVSLFMPLQLKEHYLDRSKGAPDMKTKRKVATIFTQVVERPKRKLVYRPGIKATHYFEYADEVGCDVWDILVEMKDTLFEPAGYWLPPSLVKPGTSTYVQGVEISLKDEREIPKGFEVMELPVQKLMIFQGQPYEDEQFKEAIGELWDAIETFDPTLYGYRWDDEMIRFQLEPQGYRGYIEARGIIEL